MILTEYEPTPWTITLTLEIILIVIRIYWTQKIDPRQNGSPNDTTEMVSDSLINLARNLSILTDKIKLTPLEIRAISCETNLTKGRNQTTVESDGISDFLQQLKDLPDWAIRIIDEMRKQNMIERMTKEELRAVVKEIKRRKEISNSSKARVYSREREYTCCKVPGIKGEDREFDANSPKARPHDRESKVTRNIDKRVSRIFWGTRFWKDKRIYC